MANFTKAPKPHLMTYQIARGEQGVLTYEPYKSYLLPHWRFRTVPIAQISSETLWEKFLEFYDQQDFVGMDMSRKFIQMGMTRSKRYANYKGGKKYVGGKEKGNVNEKSKGHEGKEEKEEASRIFREVWERCKAHEGYQEMKKVFLKEQKEWMAMERGKVKDEDGDEDPKATTRASTRKNGRRKLRNEEGLIREESLRTKSEND